MKTPGLLDNARRCPYCGRAGRECWTLPCLPLQDALETHDERTLAKWARHVGATITRTRDGATV